MYRSFYHLSKRPFHITPDPEFLFLSPSHGEAFAAIIYGIEQRKGFLAITGEVGVGKTTILRAYLEKTGHEQHRIIYIFNAAVSFDGLLRLMLGEFGVAVTEDGAFEMVNRLHHLLIEEYKNNRNVVLIIDEAQNMPVATLENLRMLSNLETSEDKLLQILLVGQPELDRILDLHELRQLRQRIAVRCQINPLTEAESYAYIQHRLAKAAAHGELIFAPGSLQPLIKEARGIPRIINILCDNALVTGFGYQKKPISRKIIREVVSEYGGSKDRRRGKWRLVPFAAAALVVLVLFAGFFFSHPHLTSLIKGEGQLSEISSSPPGDAAGTPPLKPSTEKGDLRTGLSASPPQNSSEGRDTSISSTTSDQQAQMTPPVMANMREQPIASVSTANAAPPPTPAAEVMADQSLSSTPAPLHAAPVSWVANRTTDAFPRPSPFTLHSSLPTPSASPPPDVITKTVKEGDCISHLVTSIYGYADKKLIEAVKEHNPHIRDINVIKAGDLIAFPRTDRMKAQPD